MEKRWGLKEDRPIAALRKDGSSRKEQHGCLGHGISHCDGDNLLHTQVTSPSAFNIGEIYSKGCFLQGKNVRGLRGRMNCPSFLFFWVNGLTNVMKAPNIIGAYRDFPASLMLTRGRKTMLEHGSSFLFLRFFLNLEPEITFPSCCIDGRKGHFC